MIALRTPDEVFSIRPQPSAATPRPFSIFTYIPQILELQSLAGCFFIIVFALKSAAGYFFIAIYNNFILIL